MIEAFLNMDSMILLWIQEHMRLEGLNPVVVFITSLGNCGTIWILTSLVLLIPKKTRNVGIICLFSLAISFIVNNLILKNLVGRIRPYDCISNILPLIKHPVDLSFPSGHAAASFAAAWVIWRKLSKKIGVPALVLAILIAFSRLYIGVHYPSDVIAGVISGIAISYLAEFIVNSLFFYRGVNKKAGET